MSAADLPKPIGDFRGQSLEPFIDELVETPADSSLSKVIGILRERGVYEVFMPEGNRCGMLSARDVLRTANIEATKPAAVMTYVPVLRKEATVGEAARLMADYRIRAVPLGDGRKIVGQVNCVRLLEQLKGKLGNDLRVTSIATRQPITVELDALAAKARDLMTRKRIDHLPVIGAGKLRGIVTSSQIVARISPPERVGSKSMRPERTGTFNFPIHEAMERNPLTCTPDLSVDKALHSILNAQTTYVLVTQWEELQGIATHRDFMTLLAEPEPEAEVPIFMVGLPDDPFEAEATKTKFRRTVNQLYRIFPDILEARSVIKSKFTKPGKERGRYEVTVHIRTPTNSYNYSEEGYELPVVYDVITDRLKRLMTQKLGRRRERAREGRRPA